MHLQFQHFPGVIPRTLVRKGEGQKGRLLHGCQGDGRPWVTANRHVVVIVIIAEKCVDGELGPAKQLGGGGGDIQLKRWKSIGDCCDEQPFSAGASARHAHPQTESTFAFACLVFFCGLSA